MTVAKSCMLEGKSLKQTKALSLVLGEKGMETANVHVALEGHGDTMRRQRA